jgi:putative ABC transport system substrate-binding protein
MKRREFISGLGLTAAWPLAASAQQAALPTIGYLSVSPANASTSLAAFREGLRQLGYDEDRNVVLRFRNTQQYDQFPTLVAELVRDQVAVIFTSGNVNAALAAKSAKTAIPIVFSTGFDPVQAGLVADMGRPGGNLTGVTFFAAELGPKRLELLRELVPDANTIALLVNPTNPLTELSVRSMQAAARSIQRQIITAGASTAEECEGAFAAIARQRPGGLIINNDSFFVDRREQLVALTMRYGIPTVHFDPSFMTVGGLMSYTDDRQESFRQAGRYVGRILNGEKPAELPVLQPVRFDLMVNLKVAKALGLEIPLSIRLRATKVIE